MALSEFRSRGQAFLFGTALDLLLVEQFAQSDQPRMRLHRELALEPPTFREQTA